MPIIKAFDGNTLLHQSENDILIGESLGSINISVYV